VGNSIGGAAAIRFAAAHPERVTALVLENPGGLDRTDDLVARIAIRAMIAFFAAGARGAPWFPAAFAAYYRMVLQRAAAAEERRRIVASAREIAPLLRDAWTGFGEPEADLRNLATPSAARCCSPGRRATSSSSSGAAGRPSATSPARAWRPSPPATPRISRRRMSSRACSSASSSRSATRSFRRTRRGRDDGGRRADQVVYAALKCTYSTVRSEASMRPRPDP
jgi:pimeloyl-ACP methyl ester carboxylesterase